MPWTYLTIAACLEIIWAISIKYTEGYTRLWPSVFNLIVAIGSFTCLAQAVKTIPIGTAYAIWTGTGTVGVALIGLLFLGEPREAARLFFIFLIAAGLIGLKFVSPSS